MGSARHPTFPPAADSPAGGASVAGLGDQLVHFFDRLSALPMPDHMIALIEELERTHAVAAPRDIEEATESLKA